MDCIKFSLGFDLDFFVDYIRLPVVLVFFGIMIFLFLLAGFLLFILLVFMVIP